MNEMDDMTGSKVDEAVAKFLTNFQFLRSLDTDELVIMADYLDLFEFERDTVVFNEGDRGDRLFFVIEGELEVLKESVSSRKPGVDRVVISKLTRGSSFGEMAIIDNFARSATVKTLTRTTLVTLAEDGFEQILEHYPKIGIKIFKGLSRMLSKKLRMTSAKFADYTIEEHHARPEDLKIVRE